MPTPLGFATAVFTIVTAVQANKPAVYHNWPACKTGTEYVTVIPKSEHVAGTTYYKRTTHRDTVKFYICRPCISCMSGIAALSVCSVRTDTRCSTECAVAGCMVDDLLGCILPGDPNDFINLAAMMDPCDPTMFNVTTPSNVVGPPIPDEVSTTLYSSNDERPPIFIRPAGDKAEGTSTSEAPVEVQTYVFASLIGLLFITIIVIICYMYMVHPNRNKNDLRGVAQTRNMIQMTNLPNTDRTVTATPV